MLTTVIVFSVLCVLLAYCDFLYFSRLRREIEEHHKQALELLNEYSEEVFRQLELLRKRTTRNHTRIDQTRRGINSSAFPINEHFTVLPLKLRNPLQYNSLSTKKFKKGWIVNELKRMDEEVPPSLFFANHQD